MPPVSTARSTGHSLADDDDDDDDDDDEEEAVAASSPVVFVIEQLRLVGSNCARSHLLSLQRCAHSLIERTLRTRSNRTGGVIVGLAALSAYEHSAKQKTRFCAPVL